MGGDFGISKIGIEDEKDWNGEEAGIVKKKNQKLVTATERLSPICLECDVM